MNSLHAVRPRHNPVMACLGFLRLWLRRPLSIGAIAPSSGRLARAMARNVDFSAPGHIVELGGGTGSITEALVANAPDPSKIVVVEREQALCVMLAARFPGIRVIHGDACGLRGLLRREGIGPVKAVVSGLPLISMPRRTRFRIVEQSFSVLDPDGVLVQFTYGPASPIKDWIADRIGIAGRRCGWVLRNLPPAFLWLYRRDMELQQAA